MHSSDNEEMTDEEAEAERKAVVKKRYMQENPESNDKQFEHWYLEYYTKITKIETKEPPQPSLHNEEMTDKEVEAEAEPVERHAKTIACSAEKLTPKKLILPPEELLAKIYGWALKLSTEQSEEKQYLWTHEGEKLLMRLRSNTGLLIGVIGPSGIGKTALKTALASELENSFPGKTISLKWEPNINDCIVDELTDTSDFSEQYVEELWYAVLDKYKKRDGIGYDVADTFSIILKKLKFTDPSDEARLLDQVLRNKAGINKLAPYTYLLEKALGHKDTAQVKENVLRGKCENAQTILLDLPDYSMRTLTEQHYDMKGIHNWWKKELTSSYGGYIQKPNLVLFIQKESFKGHFFFLKLDRIELKPIQPKELVQYYEDKWGSAFPFTNEALKYVADLSRGIFRRFKRYIGACTEGLIMAGLKKDAPKKEAVTVDDVITCVSEGQLVEDMELELNDVFPNDKILRIKTVRLLHRLRRNGESMMQTDVVKEFFDGHAKAASRFLEKLESVGYIFRDSRAGKARGQRVVHLNKGGERIE